MEVAKPAVSNQKALEFKLERRPAHHGGILVLGGLRWEPARVAVAGETRRSAGVGDVRCRPDSRGSGGLGELPHGNEGDPLRWSMIVPAPNVATSDKGRFDVRAGCRRIDVNSGLAVSVRPPRGSSCGISPDNSRKSTPVHRYARVGKMRTRGGDDSRRDGGRRTAALAILSVQPVARGLAGLEGRHGARGDGDGFAGAGIVAPPRRKVPGSDSRRAGPLQRAPQYCWPRSQREQMSTWRRHRAHRNSRASSIAPPGGEGWTIRDYRAILRSEPYASADLGAASDVTTKSVQSEAASASSSTPISPQLTSDVIAAARDAPVPWAGSIVSGEKQRHVPSGHAGTIQSRCAPIGPVSSHGPFAK